MQTLGLCYYWRKILTVLFIIVFAALLLVVVLERRALVIKARRRWGFTIILWIVAAGVGILPWWQRGSTDYLISGLFTAGVLILLTIWRQGLAPFAVINGILATRAYSALTSYTLTPDKDFVVITFYSGTMRVTRLNLLADETTVRQFLKKYAENIHSLAEAPSAE